jgi:hypothetical protein
MKVMVLLKATKETEAGILPSLELITAMNRFNDELLAAGVMLGGDGLKPTSAGARVHLAAGIVTKGPFDNNGELICGFWLWQVKSLDEAIDWIKRCPAPFEDGNDAEIELRPLYEVEDFGDIVTPEMKAEEDAFRRRVAKLAER